MMPNRRRRKITTFEPHGSFVGQRVLDRTHESISRSLTDIEIVEPGYSTEVFVRADQRFASCASDCGYNRVWNGERGPSRSELALDNSGLRGVIDRVGNEIDPAEVPPEIVDELLLSVALPTHHGVHN